MLLIILREEIAKLYSICMHGSYIFCPIGIVLDADNYLFITDSNNNRINGLQNAI
jgi:hypothetical protein